MPPSWRMQRPPVRPAVTQPSYQWGRHEDFDVDDRCRRPVPRRLQYHDARHRERGHHHGEPARRTDLDLARASLSELPLRREGRAQDRLHRLRRGQGLPAGVARGGGAALRKAAPASSATRFCGGSVGLVVDVASGPISTTSRIPPTSTSPAAAAAGGARVWSLDRLSSRRPRKAGRWKCCLF